MKLTVLVDNNTLIDRYYLGEPGFCLYIEEGEHRILFDTGYSDVAVRNAEKMGIDLNKVDTIVFSHGHNDHTGGLRYMLDMKQDVEIICHPNTAEEKHNCGLNISCPLDLNDLPENFHVYYSTQPVWITDKLVYLGQIERSWQKVKPLEDDYLYDDSALAYVGEKGLYIITGCSHSGIINICEHAMKLTVQKKLVGVVGGFHILNNDELARESADYFVKMDVKELYPCHCTDLMARIILAEKCPVRETGVSQELVIY